MKKNKPLEKKIVDGVLSTRFSRSQLKQLKDILSKAGFFENAVKEKSKDLVIKILEEDKTNDANNL